MLIPNRSGRVVMRVSVCVYRIDRSRRSNERLCGMNFLHLLAVLGTALLLDCTDVCRSDRAPVEGNFPRILKIGRIFPFRKTDRTCRPSTMPHVASIQLHVHDSPGHLDHAGEFEGLGDGGAGVVAVERRRFDPDVRASGYWKSTMLGILIASRRGEWDLMRIQRGVAAWLLLGGWGVLVIEARECRAEEPSPGGAPAQVISLDHIAEASGGAAAAQGRRRRRQQVA